MDVNLLDASGFDPKNLASIITQALKQAIATNSGPYCLIFWTSYSEKFDEIKPEVERQLKLENIPQPSLITFMGKGDVIPLTNSKEADAANAGLREHMEMQAKRSDALANSLMQVIKMSGSVGVVSAWETMLSEAASNTLGALYSEARGFNPVDHAGAFADLLSTIAVEAIGQKNAKEDPLNALTEGLLDLVLDHLRSAHSSAMAEEAVETELKARIKAGVRNLPGETIARINRLFQVELLSVPPAVVSRGLVLRPSEKFLKEAGLTEGWDHFLWKEVLHDPSRLSGQHPKKDLLLQRKGDVSARVRPLLVEVGADCDHAQRKPRSHRFLLAAEVPQDLVRDFLASEDEGRRTPYVSDAIEFLGPWPIGDQVGAAIAVCCKRFLSHQVDRLPVDCESVMRLRGSLVNHLLHRYSTLATRPGFISLRAG